MAPGRVAGVKLAEALALRADAQKRFEQLRWRVQSSARYQEGEAPAEDARSLSPWPSCASWPRPAAPWR